MKIPQREVAIIGAGPVGLDLAHQLKQRHIPYYHFEQGPIGSSLLDLAPEEVIGLPEKIVVGSVPLTSTKDPVKRDEYLAYLRQVVEKRQLSIQTFARVSAIHRLGDLWHIRTTGYNDVCHQYRAKRIVFATGNCGRRQADVFPGANSPILHKTMRHPHFYFQRRVLIVGAGADAQAAALQCASVARRVYLCCAELELSPTPGQSDLRPQLIELIQSGKVEYLANREITGLSGRKVTLSGPGRQRNELEIDFLISQPGRHPDYSLFQRLGVALKGTQMAPVHDPETMESNVPGIYIAGSIALGSGSAQRAISQGKKHNKRIIADLWAKTTGRAVVERQRALPVATATQSWWPPQLPTDAPALGVGS